MSTFDFNSWGITPSNLLAGSPAAIADNIDRIYLNTVGRHADPDGKKYWKGKIASGTDTYQTLMGALMGSKEFSGRSDAKKANPNITEAQLDATKFEGNWDYLNKNPFDTPGSALNTWLKGGGGKLTELEAAELVADAANSTDDVTIGNNVISGSRDIKRLAGGIYGGSHIPTITPEVESTGASLTQDFSMDRDVRRNLMQNQGWSFDNKEGLGINDISSFARTNYLTDQFKKAAGDDGILDRFEFETAITSNLPDKYGYHHDTQANALANYWATTGADIDEGVLKNYGLSKSGENLIQTSDASSAGPNLALKDYVEFDRRTSDNSDDEGFLDFYTWSRNQKEPEKEFAEFKSNISKEEAEAIYGPGIDEVYNYVFGVDTGMDSAGKEYWLKDLIENRAGLTQGQNWKVWLDQAFRNTEDYKFKEAGEDPSYVDLGDGVDPILPGPNKDAGGTGDIDYAKLVSDAIKNWGLDDRFSSLSGDISALQGDYKTLSNDYNTLSNDLTTGLSDLGIDFTRGLTDLGTDLTNLGGTYSDNIRDLKKEFSDTRDSNTELLKGFQDSNSRVLESYQNSIASFQAAQNAQAAYGERNRNPTVKGVRTQNELPGFKPRTSGTGFFGRGSNRLTTSSLNI